jgi:cytochrome oxidase assembly protein ShyY1
MLARPKWVGLTLGMLVLIVAFGVLSYWQWQRAQRDRVEAAPLPASQVLPSGSPLEVSSYGARVTVSGAYDTAHQLLVAQGDGSYWVVTPLRTAAGDAVPVARATVQTVDDPAVADVTAGTVTVTGVAEPYEGDPGTPSTLPPGQSDRLTAAALALPYPAAGGWVALETQAPAPTVPAVPVPPPVSAESTPSLRFQNASYAVQWLMFAAFVVFFWVRMLRDDLQAAAPEDTPRTVAPVREVY